jgi:hypothetical protein
MCMSSQSVQHVWLPNRTPTPQLAGYSNVYQWLSMHVRACQLPHSPRGPQ